MATNKTKKNKNIEDIIIVASSVLCVVFIFLLYMHICICLCILLIYCLSCSQLSVHDLLSVFGLLMPASFRFNYFCCSNAFLRPQGVHSAYTFPRCCLFCCLFRFFCLLLLVVCFVISLLLFAFICRFVTSLSCQCFVLLFYFLFICQRNIHQTITLSSKP